MKPLTREIETKQIMRAPQQLAIMNTFDPVYRLAYLSLRRLIEDDLRDDLIDSKFYVDNDAKL